MLLTFVYRADFDIIMQIMPLSFGFAYDLLWIFNLFNALKLGLESHSVLVAASKIQRNIPVFLEKESLDVDWSEK